MTQKRKISVSKILNTVFTIALICCCIIALSSASKIEKTKTLSNIEIDISNGDKYRFLDDKKVMDMINKEHGEEVTRLPIGNLDTRAMEQAISTNPWVKDAEVYIDNAHVLHLFITQRTPVTRIFETNGNSYYLDKTLSTMPLSDNYIYYTTVVTNVPPIKDDSAGHALKGQIVAIVKFIEANPFWMAQISHVEVDTGNTFVLAPLLGTQKILLGDTSRMKEKFDNLYVFYKKISNRIGWDKYEVLDLRYKGQVIASPALPWKGPIDKAMVNMNWARSMVDSSLKANKAVVSDSVHHTAAIAKVPVAVPVKKMLDKGKKVTAKPRAAPVHKANPASGKKINAKKILTKKTEKKKSSKNDKEKKHGAKYIYQKKTNN